MMGHERRFIAAIIIGKTRSCVCSQMSASVHLASEERCNTKGIYIKMFSDFPFYE